MFSYQDGKKTKELREQIKESINQASKYSSDDLIRAGISGTMSKKIVNLGRSLKDGEKVDVLNAKGFTLETLAQLYNALSLLNGETTIIVESNSIVDNNHFNKNNKNANNQHKNQNH